MATTTRIDLSKLTLLDALDLAILIEEEARDRYTEFAEQLTLHHTPEAASFFERMSKVEALHRSKLEERRKRLFGDTPSAMRLDMLWDVEAPEYDAARVFMSLHAALRASLHAEIKAHAFFDEALKLLKDTSARELFEELRAEELEHQAYVRAELAKLPPEATVNPLDYADEPVSTD